MIYGTNGQPRIDFAVRAPVGIAGDGDEMLAGELADASDMLLPREVLRFELGTRLGVPPEDVYLVRRDGVAIDPIEAYGRGATTEALAATRWILPSSIDRPDKPPLL